MGSCTLHMGNGVTSGCTVIERSCRIERYKVVGFVLANTERGEVCCV